ncbi:MAG: TolC family protein, partial [Steroidobacteraceae bacterium]
MRDRIAAGWHACSLALLAAVALPVSIAGCAAGPDFVPPAPPRVNSYVERLPTATAATRGVAGGASQAFTKGADVPGNWWTRFHSKALDELVGAALAHNHDLKATLAALEAAHETLLAQRGAFLPAVSAGFAASRQQAASVLAPVPNYPLV